MQMRRWNALERFNNVKLVTIAPELDPTGELTATLTRAGIVVSLGHTAGHATDVIRAVGAGATLATHLFNAMPPIHHRADSATVAFMTNNALRTSLIADGHHVNAASIKFAARVVGLDRLILVTDGMAGLGLSDGDYDLGDVAVLVRDGVARNVDGGLAGAVCPLPRCVVNFRDAADSSLADAMRCATAGPALVLGDESRGRLDPGARADIAVFDAEMSCVKTLVDGVVAYTR